MEVLHKIMLVVRDQIILLLLVVVIIEVVVERIMIDLQVATIIGDLGTIIMTPYNSRNYTKHSVKIIDGSYDLDLSEITEKVRWPAFVVGQFSARSLWAGVVQRLSDGLQNHIRLCESLISAENFFFVKLVGFLTVLTTFFQNKKLCSYDGPAIYATDKKIQAIERGWARRGFIGAIRALVSETKAQAAYDARTAELNQLLAQLLDLPEDTISSIDDVQVTLDPALSESEKYDVITECRVNDLNLVGIENQNKNFKDEDYDYEEEEDDSGISVIVSIDDVARLVSVGISRNGGNGGTVGGVGGARKNRDRVMVLILVKDADLLVAVVVVLGMVRDIVVVVGREVGHGVFVGWCFTGGGDGDGDSGLSIFFSNPPVELVPEQGTGLVEKAAVVLGSLAVISIGKVAMVEEGGIPAIVKAIDDVFHQHKILITGLLFGARMFVIGTFTVANIYAPELTRLQKELYSFNESMDFSFYGVIPSATTSNRKFIGMSSIEVLVSIFEKDLETAQRIARSIV
ncbi:hypothetical protein LguiB_007495 [Lonicera macranthoides]